MRLALNRVLREPLGPTQTRHIEDRNLYRRLGRCSTTLTAERPDLDFNGRRKLAIETLAKEIRA